MAELIERHHMDNSHLLQAEANIDGLNNSELQSLVAEQGLTNILSALRRGDVLYCCAHPQTPYVVYFRQKYYINPAAASIAAPAAIEQLIKRYPLLSIDDKQSPLIVRHGGQMRHYAPIPNAEPEAPYSPHTEPATIINNSVWLNVLFYTLTADGTKIPAANINYTVFPGTGNKVINKGTTAADGRALWEGENKARGYRIFYQQVGSDSEPTMASKAFNRNEAIELPYRLGARFILTDTAQTPVVGLAYQFTPETIDKPARQGLSNDDGETRMLSDIAQERGKLAPVWPTLKVDHSGIKHNEVTTRL